MRVILFGTFNSGSSALAGVLHRMGVKMFNERHGNHFEDRRVMRQLTKFLDLGKVGDEAVPFFRDHFERLGRGDVGIKHPMLSQFAEEVIEAAGRNAKLLWINRSAVRSMRGLLRRGWFSEERARQLQTHLYSCIVNALCFRSHLEIQFNDLLSDPLAVAREVDAYLDLGRTEESLVEAIGGIRPGKRPDGSVG